MTFGKKEEQIFLGRDFTQMQDYSEHTAVEIDTEVRRIIQESYQLAKDLLAANVDVLHKITEALLDKESLDGPEIDEIIRIQRPGNGEAPLSAAGADARA